MKKLVAMLGSLLVLASAVFAADPAVGLWKSIDDKSGNVTAVWDIFEQDGKLFGKIVAVADNPQNVVASACKESYKGFPIEGAVNKMHTVGTTWIYNMSKESAGNWKGGNIVNPGDGKMYGCVIKYMAAGSDKKAPVDTLGMAGTVGPIKVFQYWVKASEADIADLQAKFPAK